MTTHPLRRLSGSAFAAACALAIAAGCSETKPPVTGSGTGGDVGPVPPSPLCGGMNTGAGAAGAVDVGGMPVPGGVGIFSPFQPNYGTSVVTASVAPPAISGGTLRILADGHTAVAADPDRDQVYIVDLTAKSVRATVALNPGDEPGRVVADAAGRA